MKLLQLTDFFTGTAKEYVNIDDISMIQPNAKRVGFFRRKIVVEGSRVFTRSSREATYVKETPEQIAELIKNNKLGISQDGISQE